MNPYLIARKIVQAVILIVLTVVLVYVIYRLMPGNPAELFLFSAKSKSVSQAEQQQILARLGLAGGKWNFANFLIYLRDMFTFNFGYDYFQQSSVLQIIEYRMPYTIFLLGTAAVFSFIVGLPVGILATWFRGKKKEAAINTGSLVLSSIPYFILGVLIYIYFVAYLRWFPVTSSFTFDNLYHLYNPSVLASVLLKIALPLVSLIVVEAAAHVLTMRAAMVSILGEDFITTARAKGVPEGRIMFRHAARNAMIPVSTRMALEFALLTSGAVIVEIIFSYPGIGNELFQATLLSDYSLSEGALYVIALVVIAAYSIIDFIHAWLDPRISI